MEDVEILPNKRQKTDYCDSDKGGEKQTGNIPLWQGYHVQILEAGIGKVRSELFRKKIVELGGTLCSGISDHPNVLIVDENMTADRLYRLLKIDGPRQLETAEVVRSVWLSDCIKNKKLLPTANYQLQLSSPCPAVSSVKVISSTLQQPRSPQAAIQDDPHCSKFLSSHLNADSEADSHYAAIGEDDTEDDANSISAIPKQRQLPVCFLFSSTLPQFFGLLVLSVCLSFYCH